MDAKLGRMTLDEMGGKARETSPLYNEPKVQGGKLNMAVFSWYLV